MLSILNVRGRSVGVYADVAWPTRRRGRRRSAGTGGGEASESARRNPRPGGAAPAGSDASSTACSRRQIVSACCRASWPLGVIVTKRRRRSPAPSLISISPRRSSGFKSAVTLVRSIASNPLSPPMDCDAFPAMNIKAEYCPLVSPTGCNARSNRRPRRLAARCAARHKQASRTSRIAVLESGLASTMLG